MASALKCEGTGAFKKLEGQSGCILESTGDYVAQGENTQEHEKARFLCFHDSQGISSSNFFSCSPKDS